MLDDLGFRDVRRLFRVAQDIKNFKTLSTLRKLRIGGVVVMPLALIGGGAASLKLQSGSAIEALRIDPVQQVMMQSCIDAHEKKALYFGENVSTPQGCGCVAKLVSSVTPPAHYSSYAAIQDLAIAQYEWQYASDVQSEIDAEFDVRIENKIIELAKTESLNQTGLRHMFDYLLSADQICDTPESYQGDALESLASLTPLETPIWEGDSEGVMEIALRGASEPIRVSMNE
jgi:hypothetical protein